MKRPLTGLVVMYASGIWIGSLAGWPVATAFYLAAGLLAAFLLLHKTRFGLFALLATVFAAGILGYRQATTISSPNDITRLLEQRDQNVALRGVIVSDTGYRDKPVNNEPERLRFELKLEALQRDGQWQPASGRVLVFVSETREPEPLRYGDLIDVSAVLRVPPPVRNPGTFDWRSWLKRQRIFFTATMRKEDSCTVRAHGQGNPITTLSLRLRERFERALHYGLEGERELAGVLAAIIIGERSEIPQETYAQFQHTGVFHIFSVSGLNVGLVAVVVVTTLRLARVPRRWCGLGAIPLLVLYVFATGARPGAVRSLAMATIWLIGWALVRPADSLNTLAAAALVVLVADPAQLFDGGFVLSFAAVGALVVLTPRIQSRLQRLFASDPLLPSKLIPRWRRWLEPPLRWTVAATSASLAAWVGLLPLMAWYFNLFTVISIVANVVVIPLMGAITALGMVAMTAHAVWPWLTLTLNNANFFLLDVMIRAVAWLATVPYGHEFVKAPPVWAVWAYYGAALLLLAKWIPRLARRWATAVVVPCVGAALFLSGGRAGKVDLTVFALNDGMAMFVDAAGEQNDVLIDGGSDWSGSRVVVPFLRSRGVDRLAAIVLTRGDKAHAAGLDIVANEIPVREAIYSGLASRSKYYSQWLEDMKARRIPLHIVKAGDDLNLTPGVRVRVLNPPRGSAANRSEDNALVLAVESGTTCVLYLSDAGKTVEKRLLKAFGDLHAQVIVKGHHGSEQSCTGEFLDAVRPEAVVQAVGVRPSSRYPEPDLRERLAQRGIALYRTDDKGAVRIRLMANDYKIQTYLE